MNIFDENILIYSENICKNIANSNPQERGLLSQNILDKLRHLVEAIAQRIYSDVTTITLNEYSSIVASLQYVASRGDLKFLMQFHNMLQISVSHSIPDEDNSVRLLLKYHEWLIRIREYAKRAFGLSLLGNIEDYPWDDDDSLEEYYEKIASAIENCLHTTNKPNTRYYIHKSKPFFVNGKIYYELTITSADDYSSKFDRFTAFSNKEIPNYYAIKLNYIETYIDILNRKMPIVIIDNFQVAIRPIELEDLAYILNAQKIGSGTKEYYNFMNLLTTTGLNFVNLIDMAPQYYEQFKKRIQIDAQSNNISVTLDMCRNISQQKRPGYITLRYVLLRLRHKILKEQISDEPNNWLSNLCLKNSCIPFEKMPFYASLTKHNPSLSDIFSCINHAGKEDELLARRIRNDSDREVRLFNKVEDYENSNNLHKLVSSYNYCLAPTHKTERKLIIDGKHIYINGYVEHCQNIIRNLFNRIGNGIIGYENSIVTWMNTTNAVDSEEKKIILRNMFSKNNIAMIYGAAGTGKTTLIKHISTYFANSLKLFLANTNPATENLRRQISIGNSDFSTIASAKKLIEKNKYDVVVIDECSTVDNRTMDELLNTVSCKLLILVGDVYQIQSVQFGNWFSLARYFMPATAIYELTTPYRTENQNLIKLWNKIRMLDDGIAEYISHKKYSTDFDETLFYRSEEDEIILCLNYDGLYGINNLNRFLQNDNPNPPFHWDNQVYKVGDPVIFSEYNRFYPVLYNNLKGWIRKIDLIHGEIIFIVEVPIALNELDITVPDLELISCSSNGHSLIRFKVSLYVDNDENEKSKKEVVPFQVAYAISIHKAQGLEFNSVKVVISNQIDELISHSIFYTAITRARKALKIYWTPETQQTVLENIKPISNKQDACILSGKFGLKIINQVD